MKFSIRLSMSEELRRPDQFHTMYIEMLNPNCMCNEIPILSIKDCCDQIQSLCKAMSNN